MTNSSVASVTVGGEAREIARNLSDQRRLVVDALRGKRKSLLRALGRIPDPAERQRIGDTLAGVESQLVRFETYESEDEAVRSYQS